jgi:hypothetical protein
MGRYQVSEPAAAMPDEQRAAYRELLRTAQAGALMLLEAAYNLLECVPQLAADAAGAATACTLCTLVQTTRAVTNSSSSSSATAGEAHDGDRADMGLPAAEGADGAAAGSSNSDSGSSSSSSSRDRSVNVEVTDLEVAQVVKMVSGATYL